MNSYRLTARAEDDLLALFLDGIEKFGFPQAERYSVDLEQCFQLIATNPHMGRAFAATSTKATSYSMKKTRAASPFWQSFPQEASVY